MEIDDAVKLTQERLAQEGTSMAELLAHFRDKVSPTLIGDPTWNRILKCASKLPITLGASPFGFELPLHQKETVADLGVSLSSGTRPARFFEELANSDPHNKTAAALGLLFRDMDAKNSALREIVGRKVMLEYDIGSALKDEITDPGLFLRPGERPIVGANAQEKDVNLLADSLVSCIGWEKKESERENVRRAYLAQPADTRMDSFGVFPSRARSIRLAVMGFTGEDQISSYLKNINWPGETTAVRALISRFKERVAIVRTGANIDVQEDGIGPTLGLTLIVNQRYTKDSRYWLDGLTDWDPFLSALTDERIVVQSKLKALADWVTHPTMLFAKSGRFVLLRGIHHIKLVLNGDQLTKVKAYVFLILSGAVAP